MVIQLAGQSSDQPCPIDLSLSNPNNTHSPPPIRPGGVWTPLDVILPFPAALTLGTPTAAADPRRPAGASPGRSQGYVPGHGAEPLHLRAAAQAYLQAPAADARQHRPAPRPLRRPCQEGGGPLHRLRLPGGPQTGSKGTSDRLTIVFFLNFPPSHPIQTQQGNIPLQWAYDKQGAKATFHQKPKRWWRVYRCCSYIKTRRQGDKAEGEEESDEEESDEEEGAAAAVAAGEPACKMQLVFCSEPGQPDRWLLHKGRSHFEHSASCRGAFYTIQAERKEKDARPLKFRANISLLVRI